ncbi:Hypothetical protein ORPV_371 [Orpheovirus IHUMI-LCC2]|uniref:Uncharacterized protein n=1 Tax=Orpheovirus IHUMI-LCC2 TaxID=2023057 RepID=A0A2I2L3Z5_9VIRU|nr:Hypothetical protein ORPV_371 [Orpheovirus IHUMI-LCC2]SNW62275.1 Hypothetical protein ORPV_371 [Orpheovirus IHUMI-LCC2]
MEIIPYTEKSFILVGSDTKNYIEKLKEMGGTYGRYWKNRVTGENFSGWMFNINKMPEIEEFLRTPDTYQPVSPRSSGQGRSRQQPTSYFGQQTIQQPGLQRVIYDIKVPNVGNIVNVVIGSSITPLRVGTVLSSKNDGLLDTLYLQADDNSINVAKIVNGEWQIISNLTEHKVLF